MGSLETHDIRKNIKALEKAIPFLEEYKKLCLEHSFIIDSGVGNSCISSVSKKAIESHCEELGETLQSDLDLYRSMISGGWRAQIEASK